MATFDVAPVELFDPIIEAANNIIPKIPQLVAALIFGAIVIKILSFIASILLSLVRMPKGLRGILESMITALLWVFLMITILDKVLGLSNIALLFSGSIAAIGLALAAGGSSLASDILAGIFLAKDRDFSVGDRLSAGDKPTEGVVESMDMRRTRIRDDEGKLHVIPNSVIERKEWVVLAKAKDLKKK